MVPASIYSLIKHSTSYQTKLGSGERMQIIIPYENPTLTYTIKVLGLHNQDELINQYGMCAC